jgi:hypothetical protein
MKHKKFTYLLILGVVAVWGIIFYRIYGAIIDEDTPVVLTSKTKMEYFKMVDHDEDQVTLNLSYANPFANGSYEPVADHTVKIIDTKNNLKLKPITPPINWPNITYTGYIYNPTTKQKVAMLQINGREVMLSEGQDSFGVKVLKNAGDSVKVKYLNASKH